MLCACGHRTPLLVLATGKDSLFIGRDNDSKPDAAGDDAQSEASELQQ